MAKYDNIPGCPGYYISKRGQIYSRVIPNGNDAGKLGKVWRERRVKIMIKTPTYSTKRVKIRNKSYSVSRLVALAYIPNPENKPCVCHKDNNSLNNNVDNLYWGTQAENMQQCIRDGRYSYNRTFGKIGQNSPTSKYSNRLKLRVFRYKRRHPKVLLKELSNKFKMPISVISKIVKGIDPITKTYL